MRYTIAVLVCLLCACGSDTDGPGGDPWSFGDTAPVEPDDRGADVDDGQRADSDCEVDADCADDEYCHEPASCDAERFCREGYPPISAAAPVTVCGCDGALTSVNAGYPGPHAWSTGALARYDGVGASCDADAQPPFTYTIEFTLPPGALGDDDAPILARLSETLATEDREQLVPGSGVLSWAASGDQFVQFGVELLLDRDADGDCTPGVDTDYWAFADTHVDLETFEVSGELRPQERSSPCVHW